MMINTAKGAWLWKGRLVNNRNKPTPRTVLWIRSEKTQEETEKLTMFRLTLTEKVAAVILGEHFRADNQQNNCGFSTYMQTFQRLITSLTPGFVLENHKAKRYRTDVQTEKFSLKEYEEPLILLSSPRLADVTCEMTFRES